MKLALIPPFDLLGYSRRTTFQLMLPQLVTSPRYANTYDSYCTDSSMYVILDNGAAEGYEGSDSDLIRKAELHGVQELVIPDVVGQHGPNLSRAVTFLNRDDLPDISYMFVPQGKTFMEFYQSAIWGVEHPKITTIGLPRHMLATCQDPTARIALGAALQSVIRQNGISKDLHLLGSSPMWAGEAKVASEERFGFRSMDTSLPFSATWRFMRLVDGISRPPNYFESSGAGYSQELLDMNVKKMIKWVERR